MLALVIAACLSTKDTCQDFQLLYDPHEVTLSTCLAAGQVETRSLEGNPRRLDDSALELRLPGARHRRPLRAPLQRARCRSQERICSHFSSASSRSSY